MPPRGTGLVGFVSFRLGRCDLWIGEAPAVGTLSGCNSVVQWPTSAQCVYWPNV